MRYVSDPEVPRSNSNRDADEGGRLVFTCGDGDDGRGNLPLPDCVATAGAGDALSAASAISSRLGDSSSKILVG